jgi:hypothetical protein
MMLKDKGFETMIASDTDYERVFCEIYFDGRFVALVSQERGEGLFDLETPGPGLNEEGVIHRVDLLGLQDAIETCRRRLSGNEQ